MPYFEGYLSVCLGSLSSPPPHAMAHRLVVKVGTSVLTGGTPQLDRPRLVDLARQCAQLRARGTDVILVTSGAVAAGREHLGFPTLGARLADKQLLAAVGQSALMWAWSQYFAIYGVQVGQVLLTRADVHSRERFLNARDTLNALLEQGIVPIVNENDAVATAEIKVGDNDNLSALVALLVEADQLALLTDQEGLFTADPRSDPNASLITEVDQIDDALRALAGGSGTALGTGGMATKLQAADTARRGGTDVVIAQGSLPDVITRLAGGEALGTRFGALGTPLDARKRWIFAGAKALGTVQVDEGAARRLREAGASLLAVGVTAVDGAFRRGDTVRVLGPEGAEVGRGLVQYDAHALGQIIGQRSDAIENTLGYSHGPAVHRDDFILSQAVP